MCKQNIIDFMPENVNYVISEVITILYESLQGVIALASYITICMSDMFYISCEQHIIPL